jgi:hypothetical protein
MPGPFQRGPDGRPLAERERARIAVKVSVAWWSTSASRTRTARTLALLAANRSVIADGQKPDRLACLGCRLLLGKTKVEDVSSVPHDHNQNAFVVGDDLERLLDLAGVGR